MPGSPRIFASGVFGSDYDLWGAWSFTDAGTRNKLGAVIGPDDYCLAIGMTSLHTPPHERGRLLSLLKIGPEQIWTRDLVDPDHWRRSVERFGDKKWLHAFPIRSVERFDAGPGGLPERSAILPRIGSENRYMQVGRYYLELTPGEVERVLALPRTPEPRIFSSPIREFASRLLKIRNGPPPSTRTRTLTAHSGPAATYLMELSGSALESVVSTILGRPSERVFKVGFSGDPARRLIQLNAYLPCDESLNWKLARTQWHEDEINAWAMEQRIFAIIADRQANRFKGEMLTAELEEIDAFWSEAMSTTQRPTEPIEVPVDS